ncbi:hypothetical protein P5673_016454 [Acropora cervicornis]|uniref:Uncharacterized protein n=1 Tax=Acropora cervicornis TaxID=6130 RepID=A0AAD9QGU2_ACRCE|nr:hypothetical protein P5673_016454 [Acropora cervicornis]
MAGKEVAGVKVEEATVTSPQFKFKTPDVIGLPSFPSGQSNHVSSDLLVPRAQAQSPKRNKLLWGRE